MVLPRPNLVFLAPPYAFAAIGRAAFAAMNSVPSASMRWSTTASFRANATLAFFMLVRLAIAIPQLFKGDALTDRERIELAAS